jgi:hypothetical protein
MARKKRLFHRIPWTPYLEVTGSQRLSMPRWNPDRPDGQQFESSVDEAS